MNSNKKENISIKSVIITSQCISMVGVMELYSEAFEFQYLHLNSFLYKHVRLCLKSYHTVQLMPFR